LAGVIRVRNLGGIGIGKGYSSLFIPFISNFKGRIIGNFEAKVIVSQKSG